MKAVKNSWLINPALDLSFFIAAPLLIVPAFQFLLGYFSLTAFKLGILSVSATGHHLPGFIRAYTDGKVFRHFKARLIIVPSLLILLAFASAYLKLGLIFYVLIVWSTWHGSMQIHGFLRIYDVKAGFASPSTARIDFWMCLTWFVQVVLWSTPKKTSIISSFYLSGGPLIPVDWARYFERGWLILTLAVTAAYLWQLAWNGLRHGYFNLPKLLCMASSFAFWGYCMISVNHLIVGLILWEIFHDLQYNVFVWNYNHNRVRRGLSQSKIERFLFQLNGRKLALYGLCIVAYGCIGLLTQDLLNTYENRNTYATFLYQIGNVFTASALIHFYTDGFIWKVRDGKVQADLGVQATGGYRNQSGVKHWAFVSLFFLAAGGLGASEYFHWNFSGGQSGPDNLVELVPKSGYANFMKASGLQSAGMTDSAIFYFDQAIEYDSNYNFSHLFIGELKRKAGDTAGAISHYEKAAASDPRDEVVRANLAELYLRNAQYEKAAAEYRLLSTQVPTVAEYPFKCAWALLQMKRGFEAKPYLERSLELDPAQPRAWNYLGMVEQAGGDSEKAGRFYRKSLELDSNYTHARENLSALSEMKSPGPPRLR